MKPTDLRGILKYVPSFREKVFVLGIDGAIVTDENFANLLLDIAVLRSLRIRVVLVHGAGAQIRALADEQHFTPSDLGGAGVTDAATLRVALTAANRLTHEILEGLSAHDIRAASTNGILAHPLGIIGGVDHLFTGKVERIDAPLFQTLLENDILPVVPPLGFDGEGRTYRVNSDAVARALAETLKASKLIYLTTFEGLLNQDRVWREIKVDDLEAMLPSKLQTWPGDMVSKARHAAGACRAGVPRVHIIDGRVDEGLLAEVFSNEGIGTLVYANEYQAIRRALKKDVRTILKLIENSVATTELVKRSRASVEKHIGDFYLFEIDGNPVACVALHAYPESKKGELACLYVSPSHENQGIGRRLVQFIEEKAREANLSDLFALSTQAFTYFQSKAGFLEGSPDDLPTPRREKFEQSGRNSKVLVKHLRD